MRRALLVCLLIPAPIAAQVNLKPRKPPLNPEQDPAFLALKAAQEAAEAAEAKALLYCVKLLDAKKPAVVRKQAALAVKACPDLNSWAVVVYLRACEDDMDVEVRAAVGEALAAVAHPKTPDDLHGIILSLDHPHAARGAACQTLAREFPADPKTVAVLRQALLLAEVEQPAAQALEMLKRGANK